MILTQTKTIFFDAYRELNAKKLFWITMALTILFALVLATLGINEQGVTFLWFEMSFIPLNTDIIEAKTFYLAAFSTLGISLWLSWIATIIAIISTSGIIPDLVTAGNIESMLARPISRVRLFLTKYATGLMFVALQVAAYAVLSMLIIWVRGGYFEPRILLAVPIVVSFYSFLYCVCALIGLLTKSTMTAMMITGLFWAAIFVLNAGEAVVIQFEETTKIYVQERQARVELARENTVKLFKRENPDAGDPTDEQLEERNPFLSQLEESLAKDQQELAQLELWSSAIFAVKTVFPKTAETIDLLNRELIDPDAFTTEEETPDPLVDPTSDIEVNQSEVQQNMAERYQNRSVLWILGTSFAFEFVILTLCCWVFARRDF